MILRTITIENFRGIHKARTFNFEDSKFILLSAQNGFGKTTLLDAIEWVLTGDIGRLREAYDNRSTNKGERQKNNAGILRNKNSKSSEKVSVILTFLEQNKVFTIKREEKKDSLGEKNNWADITVIEGDEEKCKAILGRITDNNFYHYHFCDIQKSIHMQSYKRDKLVDFFSEFITDYSAEENCVANLERYSVDLEQKIKCYDELKKTAEDKVKAYQEKLEQLKNGSEIIPYPLAAIYTGETIGDLSGLSKDGLEQQLLKIKTCTHWKLMKALETLVFHDRAVSLYKRLNSIGVLLKSNQSKIDEVLKIAEDGQLGPKIEELGGSISRYLQFKITEATLTRYARSIVALGYSEFSQEIYSAGIEKVKELRKQQEELNAYIVTLTTGNRLLDRISNLLGVEDDLITYRKSFTEKERPVKCPVCGSERFDQLEEEEILIEVKKYVTDNERVVGEKKKEVYKLEEEIKNILSDLVQKAEKVLAKFTDMKKEEKKHLEKLKEESEAYFILKKQVAESYPQITADTWSSISEISKLMDKVQGYMLTEEKRVSKISEFVQIYKALYLKEPDLAEIENLYVTEKALEVEPPVICAEFTVRDFLLRTQSIRGYLGHQELIRTRDQLRTEKENIKTLLEDRELLQKLKERTEKHIIEIRACIAQLKENEYRSVGPYLQRLYKKLARVSSIEKIEIQNDNNKVSLLDEKGANIVNVLSNGQLSVFMLAYFFAGILTRRKEETCKVYFIDDLTACMDDVNMLAFLDLMKYQMLSEDLAIEQLFFASCDERVCELLKYKLRGCQVPYVELNNSSFS